MKKFYILLLAAFASNAQAQIENGIYNVPNNNFEESIGYGNEIRNWGQFFLVPVTLSENGESTFDLITFDNTAGFCNATTDSYSGGKAMKITNAFNETTQTVIPGKSNLFNEDISVLPTGWNTGIPVPLGADIDFLAFFYKFMPLGNDIAEARIELFNDNGESIGLGKLQISEPAYSYTSTVIPILITPSETPVFMTIGFSMAAEGSVPVFGSSLIIDDISVNANLLQTQLFDVPSFLVWPTNTDHEINIRQNGNASGNHIFSIVNIEGKIVQQTSISLEPGVAGKIDVSQLSGGVYFLKSSDGFTARFIKK
jgi:hypothetical protein